MKALKASGAVPKFRAARRVVVAVTGGTITLVGIAMIVLPGPAIVVIPIGLSILATEFVWARRYVKRARRVLIRLKSNARRAPPR
jgi:tellurite resistance protein TerC